MAWEFSRRIGILSNLTVPIRVGGQPVCVLGTSAFRQPREWPDPVVDRVRLAGQILANALHRQRVETELHAAVADLERAREELQVRLDEIREFKDRLEAENVYLRTEIRHDRGFDAILGQSWHRLLGGQRLIMGDYVRGPEATRGAGGAGGRSC